MPGRAATSAVGPRPYLGAMPLLLVIAFIVVPLVELWVIGLVADALTLGPTLVLLLLDSVVGAVLVRREGSRAWQAFRSAIGEGRVPDMEIIQGALLLFGGALLLTPGFVTDVLGLALVLPVTRAPLARLIRLRAVPIPLQVGTGVWNSSRTRGDRRADEGTRGAGTTTDQPSIEVVSVERDEQDEDV